MEESSEILLVPHDRIGVLIGPKGAVKRQIEKKTQTKIDIESEEGEVEITQKGDVLKYLKALSITKAIARGFSPENALLLLQDERVLEIIDVRDTVGKNKSAITAKKGRVIGAKGKARNEIEHESGTKISVYGKTISIIGKPEEIQKAIRAINLLLGGASHDMAYDYLKKDFEKGKFEL
ncbi:MAG TPA: KH domain-containing protein [archaeon]|nr:KH domain-containing protein [archaeon]